MFEDGECKWQHGLAGAGGERDMARVRAWPSTRWDEEVDQPLSI